jgi:hypothetical protein
LPAFAACSIRSAWVKVGVQISTAPIVLSAMIASIEATPAPNASAALAAAVASGSATAASFARGFAATLPP